MIFEQLIYLKFTKYSLFLIVFFAKKIYNVYALAKVLDISVIDISDLRPEKWLTDSVEQNGIGNVAINGQNVGVTISCMEQIESFRQDLISQIIMLDIDPVAKDTVLKTITAFKRGEK